MITLPLLPLMVVELVCSALVIIFTWKGLHYSRRLLARDPENALWLFLDWLMVTFLIFACFHAAAHLLRDNLLFGDYIPRVEPFRTLSGAVDSIIFVVISAFTLFFHRIQRLYRRMEADHHQLEQTSQEILALNREMEALVMERTMSEMALGMAHGIRNPLHVIGGFSHRLLRKTDPDDPTRTWLAAITEEAKRIEQMVTRFESLAQRKVSFFNQEDLNEIVSETLELLQPELRAKNIFLVEELHPVPLVSRLNKHLLKVALAHLIRNAVEASRNQGQVLVRTYLETDHAVLVIQDTGRGMSPEVVDKVFIPFYTTKIGGTGLGMVFVRQIVDEHRGAINLDSELNRGTTVTIRLPLRFSESPGVTGEENASPAAPQPTGGE